jgi:L-ornithine N5-oxygenase
LLALPLIEIAMETMTHKGKAPLPSREPSSSSRTTSEDSSHYDIVSVGFGPAALAIAIAMRDAGLRPRVLFLEKQPEFGWHTGMLLPGTKMQISFIKDLATLRNPRSHFTFLNYLHQKDRLVQFTNLSTHTPFREEFNDYMKWCASHFNDWVRYGQEVISIAPAPTQGSAWPAEYFKIVSRDTRTGQLKELSAKNVIVANGRQPAVPAGLSLRDEPVLVHSSAYMNTVPKKFQNPTGSYRFAVVGGGQSAVEIAEDLLSRYPNAKVSLVVRAPALKPSDDSPL